MDDCGQCFGLNEAMDCAGVCFGDAYEDACGSCDNIPENDCEPSLIYGSATLSAHPDSIYFSFEQGVNSSDTTGMDIMISGNEGTNFGSEARYVWDGLNWVLFPAFDYPSPIYYLSPDSSLASITSVPMVDENWPTISWDWPNGNGGQPLAVGNVWAVYCRTTHNYAVMEVTNVTNSWDYPRFSFNYYYQPDGSSNFSDGEIYGCTDPEALNYNPDATMDDGSCYTFLDCNDDPDGSAFWDECATCVGGNTGLIPGWSMDDCGQCSGMNEVMDCNEDCFGSAFVDNCGECVDGNTGLEPYWALDDCGICFGDNQNMDCAGVCFGEAYEDDCGVCDNIPGNDCEIETDCAGVPDGNAFWDDCGLCVGGTTGLIPNEGCAAQIISINDVQNDQGGRVYVTFNKSPADDSIPGRTTEGYTVERLDQIDGQSVWIAVISGYAYGQDIYIYEVTTLLDSSDVSDGLTGFRIISGMDEGTWISENDYGYSVDNIAPSPPAQLLLAFTSGLIILDWDDIVEPDYQYFTVYRDNNQMGYAVDSHFIDTTFVYGEEQNYYVTATDNHGNESLPSNVETVIGGSAGDVNGDSDLNVSDLVILVDMILGGEYEEYQAWAGDLNGDGVLNVLDIVIVVDLILNGGLSRGDLLYEAQILYGNGELLIKGTGSIAGVQLQLAGEYQLTQTSLPIGWESHHMNGMLLLFDSMGAMPINDLKITYSGDMIVESALTADWYGNGLMADIDLVPEKFSVKPSFPNPFNPETNISFELPIDCYISIVIYDGVGRKIESLLNENIQAGYHSIKWNASGRASGIYYVKLIAPEYTKTQKVVLLK
ncbi:MAG: T9SS type A sorting domain-containing protein, partial [Candidatus Marinimicrobia bacterium]|nr:T9SS type A sorting domain-containing protein [Candidatus Neomarinimicrobiota bacterium]